MEQVNSSKINNLVCIAFGIGGKQNVIFSMGYNAARL